MNWAKKAIFLSMLFVRSEAIASDTYLINFGDDLWSSSLLSETCPEMLKGAVSEVLQKYLDESTELVAVLPKELEYQYFKIEFKELKNGMLFDLETPIVYQFQYWTHRDRHERCVKVEPYNIAN